MRMLHKEEPCPSSPGSLPKFPRSASSVQVIDILDVLPNISPRFSLESQESGTPPPKSQTMQRLTVSPATRALLRRQSAAFAPARLPAYAAAAASATTARASLFSTQRRLLDAQKSSAATAASSSTKQQPSSTAAQSSTGGKPAAEDNPFETNFAGLGLSKNMKVFLIIVVSIFGTMETWMYCKAIWRWWNGAGDEKAAALQE